MVMSSAGLGPENGCTGEEWEPHIKIWGSLPSRQDRQNDRGFNLSLTLRTLQG
jgi:hypothetical protein